MDFTISSEQFIPRGSFRGLIDSPLKKQFRQKLAFPAYFSWGPIACYLPGIDNVFSLLDNTSLHLLIIILEPKKALCKALEAL